MYRKLPLDFLSFVFHIELDRSTIVVAFSELPTVRLYDTKTLAVLHEANFPFAPETPSEDSFADRRSAASVSSVCIVRDMQGVRHIAVSTLLPKLYFENAGSIVEFSRYNKPADRMISLRQNEIVCFENRAGISILSISAMDVLRTAATVNKHSYSLKSTWSGSSYAVSPTGKTGRIFAIIDQGVVVWDYESLQEEITIPIPGVCELRTHGENLFCIANSGNIHYYDVSTGTQLHTLEPPHGSHFVHLCRGDNTLAAGIDGSATYLYDVPSRTQFVRMFVKVHHSKFNRGQLEIVFLLRYMRIVYCATTRVCWKSE